MVKEVYSPGRCKEILDLVKADPQYFLMRCKQNPNIKIWEVHRALKAWGIEA